VLISFGSLTHRSQVLYDAFLLAEIMPRLSLFGGSLVGFNYIFASIAMFLVLATQASLCGFHIYIALLDMTTLDWIGEKQRYMVEPGPSRMPAARIANLSRMMGPRIAHWVLPLRPTSAVYAQDLPV
jgi:hypothetical protein